MVGLPALRTDLEQTATTPNLSYITPNLCNDGHDQPCVDGQPGGLASADTWLRTGCRGSWPRRPSGGTGCW